MIELARRYGRYGYRRIAALLRDAGWQVNDKRVERLWRREGLKVPGKQPKRGRLWLNDGSCVRLRAGRADHVWSYDERRCSRDGSRGSVLPICTTHAPGLTLADARCNHQFSELSVFAAPPPSPKRLMFLTVFPF